MRISSSFLQKLSNARFHSIKNNKIYSSSDKEANRNQPFSKLLEQARKLRSDAEILSSVKNTTESSKWKEFVAPLSRQAVIQKQESDAKNIFNFTASTMHDPESDENVEVVSSLDDIKIEIKNYTTEELQQLNVKKEILLSYIIDADQYLIQRVPTALVKIAQFITNKYLKKLNIENYKEFENILKYEIFEKTSELLLSVNNEKDFMIDKTEIIDNLNDYLKTSINLAINDYNYSKNELNTLKFILDNNKLLFVDTKTMKMNDIPIMDINLIQKDNFNISSFINYNLLTDAFNFLNQTSLDNLMKDENFLELIQVSDQKDTADEIIQAFFINNEFTTNDYITNNGLKLFQKLILNDCFQTNEIRLSKNAGIIQGIPLQIGLNTKNKNNETINNSLIKQNKYNYIKKIEENYNNNPIINENIDYLIVLNEKNINLGLQLTEVVMDELINQSPAVIIYPKKWLNDEENILVNAVPRAIYSLIALFSTVTYFNSLKLENSLNAFNLAMFSFGISYLSNLIESYVASTKNVSMIGTFLPSWFMGNFGYQTKFISIPKNKNDLFDITFSGVGSKLLLSVITLYVGLYSTITTAASTITSTVTNTATGVTTITQALPNDFIKIPISLLQTNTILSEIVAKVLNNYNQLFSTIPSLDSINVHYLTLIGKSILLFICHLILLHISCTLFFLFFHLLNFIKFRLLL